MSTENEYNFRNLAITNIGCDEARKIMDFFIHMLDRKINFRISTQKNVMLLVDLIYREPLPMVNYFDDKSTTSVDAIIASIRLNARTGCKRTSITILAYEDKVFGFTISQSGNGGIPTTLRREMARGLRNGLLPRDRKA